MSKIAHTATTDQPQAPNDETVAGILREKRKVIDRAIKEAEREVRDFIRRGRK